MISDDEDEMPIYDCKGRGKVVLKPTESHHKAHPAFIESDDKGDGVNEEDNEDKEVKDAYHALRFKRHHTLKHGGQS